MKPFNLEEAKAGKPVCTRIGLPVRIVCFDAACGIGAPILALVKQFGMNEQPMLFHTDGKAAGDCSPTYDLFMKPEKQEGWINIYKGRECSPILDSERSARGAVMGNDDYITTLKIEWEE